ncbi:SMI1/KNR4 family protein [Mycobacteriaceae bacterium NPDC060252]
MNPLIARLDAALRAVHPEFLAIHAPGATIEQIDALEALAGKPLPGTLRDLLAWHNGVGPRGVLATFAGPWNFMSVEQIIGAIEMLRDLLEHEPRWKEWTWWGYDWIPFLEDNFGDHICVDLDGGGTLENDGQPFTGGIAGQIMQFDHAAAYRVVAAPSFDTWLTALVQAIEEHVLLPETETMNWGIRYALDESDEPGSPTLDDVIARLAPGYPIYLTCPNYP